MRSPPLLPAFCPLYTPSSCCHSAVANDVFRVVVGFSFLFRLLLLLALCCGFAATFAGKALKVVYKSFAGFRQLLLPCGTVHLKGHFSSQMSWQKQQSLLIYLINPINPSRRRSRRDLASYTAIMPLTNCRWRHLMRAGVVPILTPILDFASLTHFVPVS